MSLSTPLDPRRWRALAVLAVAQFMVVLDATIVNVALPAIRTDLHFATDDLQWVVNAYTLLFGGFLLLGGRTADLLGRRRLFLAGLALFTGASLAGGFATSPAMLVAARAVQGLGAAMLSPAALALVTTIFPPGRERSTALGIWASLAGLGGTAGVVAGGALVDAVGWQWVFFVNVPIGLAVVPFILRLVAESRDPGRARSFDVAGALTATGGVLALVYAVIQTDHHAWGSASTLLLLALAVALLGTFVAVEARSRAPLVPLRLFAARTVSSGNLGQALNGGIFVAAMFLSTLYLQTVLGMSALTAGAAFVPMGIAAISGATAAGQLVNRFGTRPVFITGAILSSLALVLLSRVHAGGSYAGGVLPGFVLLGLGFPLCGVPNTISAMSGVPQEQAGIASGMVNAAFQIGGAVGLATITTFATSHTTHLLSGGSGQLDALASGYGRGFAIAAGLGIANIALALVVAPRLRPGAATDAELERDALVTVADGV